MSEYGTATIKVNTEFEALFKVLDIHAQVMTIFYRLQMQNVMFIVSNGHNNQTPPPGSHVT